MKHRQHHIPGGLANPYPAKAGGRGIPRRPLCITGVLPTQIVSSGEKKHPRSHKQAINKPSRFVPNALSLNC